MRLTVLYAFWRGSVVMCILRISSMSWYFSSEVSFLLSIFPQKSRSSWDVCSFPFLKLPPPTSTGPVALFYEKSHMLKGTEWFPFAHEPSHNLRTPGHATCQPSGWCCNPHFQPPWLFFERLLDWKEICLQKLKWKTLCRWLLCAVTCRILNVN